MSDQQQPKPTPGPDIVHTPATPEMRPPDVPLGVPVLPPNDNTPPAPNETPSSNPEEIPDQIPSEGT